MHLLLLNVAACAVALVYCIYQTHRRLAQKKHRLLRQRVAYMLWTVAVKTEHSDAELIGS